MEFSQDTARNFIRVAESFPNSETLRNLSISKVYNILELPSDQREEFILETHNVNGQSKTVDEMTTRELWILKVQNEHLQKN
ncbi:DUF3102 domain-containing protein [Clostridium sp. 19966]|nr:DUF3102 domain-containing protein [Clostridium sp. 19966]